MKQVLSLTIVAVIVLSLFGFIAPNLTVHAAGHWYAGAVYPQTSQNASAVSMTLTVPSVLPDSNAYYAMLLSAWTSTGSYVQLGFEAALGVWELTYSWTSGPVDNPVYHSAWVMALSLGASYRFDISTENSITTFNVFHNDLPVWNLDVATGGNYLILSNTYAGYVGFTVYEEVYQSYSPSFDFNFSNTFWMSTTGTYNVAVWTSFLNGAPSNVATTIKGNSVFVNNHYVAPPPDTKPPSVTSVYVSPTYFKPRYGQTTKLHYTLSESCLVTVKIYNSYGTLIRTLLSSVSQSSGAHTVTWNGKNSSGSIVRAGTYTFKLYVKDKAGNKATPYPINKTVKVT